MLTKNMPYVKEIVMLECFNQFSFKSFAETVL